MLDLACSWLLFSLLIGGGAAYFLRMKVRGRLQESRLDGEGSALLGRSVMEGTYWGFEPVVRLLLRLGATPNKVTAASLVLVSAAAVALALGHFGVGAVLATAGSLCDMLDGILARRLGTGSDAGEVFDATADRYGEFLLLGGLAVHYRGELVALLVVLGAILGSFMVSYATAKAEALHLVPPKGPMRRAERAFYEIFGVNVAPIWAAYLPFGARPGPWGAELPTVLALALVAVVGNYSGIVRMVRTVRLLHERAAGRAVVSAPTGPTPVPPSAPPFESPSPTSPAARTSP